MKKNYQTPEIKILNTAMPGIICASVTNIDGDAGIGYGGGGTGPAHVKGRYGDLWEDEEVEDVTVVEED